MRIKEQKMVMTLHKLGGKQVQHSESFGYYEYFTDLNIILVSIKINSLPSRSFESEDFVKIY